jgi:succinate dehydrogenase / fumarate reductase flavoprotein subunit
VHPTSIPGEDKLRLMSESVRGEGSRLGVPKAKGDTRDPLGIAEDERWYFLRRSTQVREPGPRDVATREIFHVCRELGMGIGDGVYLDVTHIPASTLDAKIKGVMEIYESSSATTLAAIRWSSSPMHYSMGACVTLSPAQPRATGGSLRNQANNIPGLYASGEADYAYHGANWLGANSLLSCIYGDDRRPGDGQLREETPELHRRPVRGLRGCEEAVGRALRRIDRMTGRKSVRARPRAW